jgi:hypothetical protein
MAEVSVHEVPASTTRSRSSQGVWVLAWRNLWRNRRRTWLTCGGIAFAVWLLVFALSMQNGTFEIMIDNGARLALGHMQIQHPEYPDDPRLEYTIGGSDALVARLNRMHGVELAVPRVQGFALMSFGERSFGAQIMGVRADLLPGWSSLPGMSRVTKSSCSARLRKAGWRPPWRRSSGSSLPVSQSLTGRWPRSPSRTSAQRGACGPTRLMR